MCEKTDSDQYKCHFCSECLGYGCISELPGMGGIRENSNFQLNCAAWDALPATEGHLPAIRLAPITGAVENIGYPDERQFYFDIIAAALEAGAALSIGDGCPDIKLLSGIEAVCASGALAAVFIKPYNNVKILERMEWSTDIAEIMGVDIDSYNIVTMRNLVQLEKKSIRQLLELKKKTQVPFAIKGVFRKEDIELIKEVKPDITVISNHGGRVENGTGSTAAFLAEHRQVLKNHTGQIWVDGGIRKLRDLQAAAAFGVSEVLIGRPFITALLRMGRLGISKYVKEKLLSGGPQNCASLI